MHPILRNLKAVGGYFRTPEEKAKILSLIGHAEPVPVAFKVEPENPHDPHAVAVMVDVAGEWVHGGYIPATVSALFAHFLAENSGLVAASCDVGTAKGQPEITVSVSLTVTAHHG